jgi:predicted transcriptional regulator
MAAKYPVRLASAISAVDLKRLAEAAARLDVSQSQWIRQAIRQRLEREPAPRPTMARRHERQSEHAAA